MSELEQLAEQVRACQKCRLAQGRLRAVPGEGPEDADILFIGEAPGFNEDRQGRPFVGASGKLLEQLIANLGLTRKQVYIANVVKCRPPENRCSLAPMPPMRGHQFRMRMAGGLISTPRMAWSSQPRTSRSRGVVTIPT